MPRLAVLAYIAMVLLYHELAPVKAEKGSLFLGSCFQSVLDCFP